MGREGRDDEGGEELRPVSRQRPPAGEARFEQIVTSVRRSGASTHPAVSEAEDGSYQHCCCSGGELQAHTQQRGDKPA